MSDTLAVLTELLKEAMDDDLADLDVGPDTSFQDDLELESIELVALSELIEARWGGEVDFTAWLSSKSLDEVIGLTVGDVVAYVDSCRS